LANEKSQRTVKLRIKHIGNKAVFARTGTEDYLTLCSTFYNQFHLPPITLKPDSVILDLGSNIGVTVLHLKHLYPSSRIIGVEMDEDNYKLAELNVAGVENVELINSAISVNDGIVSYNKSDNVDAYHVTANDDKSAAGGLVSVNSITIQSLLSKYNLKTVDFMKMDIEGEEIKIFDEQADLTWLNSVKTLNIEIHGDSVLLQKILSILERHGFRAWKDTNHWSAILAVKS
jgi:FkbM family methyltransferase